MKALVVDPTTKQVKLTNRPMPEPAAGEALVRVRQAGIVIRALEFSYQDPIDSRWIRRTTTSG